jgi:hypothetical protein
MSLYKSARVVGGYLSVAICDRCGLKKYYGELQKDPNNGLSVCKNCVDDYDPYKLPARRTEKVSISSPLPDEELV